MPAEPPPQAPAIQTIRVELQDRTNQAPSTATIAATPILADLTAEAPPEWPASHSDGVWHIDLADPPPSQLLRLSIAAPGETPLRLALDLRDGNLHVHVRWSSGGPLVSVDGSHSRALVDAQMFLQTQPSLPSSSKQYQAWCRRASAAVAALESPAIAANVWLLRVKDTLAAGCPQAASVVLARAHELGPTAPVWGLEDGLLQRALQPARADPETAAEADQFMAAVIADHANDALVASVLVNQLFAAEGDLERARTLYQQLQAPRFAGSIWVHMARNPDHLAVGSQVPAFTVTDLDGSELSTDSLRGQPFVLEFWGTWCEGCIEELPQLHAAFASTLGLANPKTASAWRRLAARGELGPGPVRFISVAAENDVTAVAAFRGRSWPMPWTHVLSPLEQPESLTTQLKISVFPTVLFVDATGTIVQRGGDLQAGVQRLLGAG